MKHKNSFFKFVVFNVAWIAFFAGIAGFSLGHVLQEDPNFYESIGQKLGMRMHRNFYGFTIESEPESQNRTESSNQWNFPLPEQSIELTVVNAEIGISSNEASEVSIEASGVVEGGEGKLLETQFQNDRLELKMPEGAEVEHLKIQIHLPSKYKKALVIHAVRGDVLIDRVTLEKLEIKAVSGEVRSQKMAISNVDIKTVSALVDLESQPADLMKISTVSGNVNLRLASGDETQFELKSASGNEENAFTSVAGAKRQVAVKTVSGNIRIFQ